MTNRSGVINTILTKFSPSDVDTNISGEHIIRVRYEDLSPSYAILERLDDYELDRLSHTLI